MRLVAFGAAMSLACGPDGTEEGRHLTPKPSALLSSRDGGRATPRVRPGPGAARGAWALRVNGACEGCHLDEATAWRASRHHRSNQNAAYRSAFEKEPSRFCTACHAPEAANVAAPTAEESALGVGCVSCHVVGDDDAFSVLAGPRQGEPSLAPHKVQRSADFATSGACAGCHEFRFPGRSGDLPGAFMQTTVLENAAIGDSVSCASCHMPAADHAFGRVRDPEWLRRGLVVSASAVEGIAQIRLSQPRPGHAYPTGDLFRRLQVEASWLDSRGHEVARASEYLARHFVIRPGHGSGRTLVDDNRVHDGETLVELEPVTASDAVAIKWRVTLQRMATVLSGRTPHESEVESEVLLYEGSLSIP